MELSYSGIGRIALAALTRIKRKPIRFSGGFDFLHTAENIVLRRSL